jgi:hypothetical protein
MCGAAEQGAQGAAGLDRQLLCPLESPRDAEAGYAEVRRDGRRRQSVPAHSEVTDDGARGDGSGSMAVADDFGSGQFAMVRHRADDFRHDGRRILRR